ncbi:hypothetical protein DIE06_29100 [Burkholderia sp. Bp8998]|nr:hypothetical protein DIE06_29100 [Burkholderia sp. Bp8998]
MLTFCRRCRAPKGARKPGVGPVACYRGMATAVTSIAYPTRRAQSRPRGLAMACVPLPTGPCRFRPQSDGGISRCRRTLQIRQTVTQVTHYPA